ncbi:hypothetical protein M9H77_36042 [Catharanthus roseus]|uniref:Uncharacterized protein n=1 Tax=Catharanthus roseus TaxID=4058 RepID=A0ACB9ZSW4_CATRO|nr:hypothetical protein M9H77_36042 [Catharanthus roseus]
MSAFDRNLKVSCLIDFEQRSWKRDLIRTHFNPYEAEEILKIPLYDDWPRNEQVPSESRNDERKSGAVGKKATPTMHSRAYHRREKRDFPLRIHCATTCCTYTGWLLLETAAWTSDGASIGILIRDHLGRVRILLTTALANSYSDEHVETIAIREVLRLAGRFWYTNYTIERILSSLGHIHQQILFLVHRSNLDYREPSPTYQLNSWDNIQGPKLLSLHSSIDTRGCWYASLRFNNGTNIQGLLETKL